MQLKVIRSPKNIASNMLAQFEKEADIVTREAQRRFEELVSDWDNEVTFTSDSKIVGNNIIMEVKTDSQIFHWVDKGTKPHTIRPRPNNRRQIMRFLPDYSARTSPGTFRSNPAGGQSSGDEVFSREVHHPGIAARNFGSLEGRFMRRRLASRLFRALRKVRV